MYVYEPGNVRLLFDNNLVYQSPCESILKIAAFLAPRRLPIVGTGTAALVAESWQSRYYIIYYRCRCSDY